MRMNQIARRRRWTYGDNPQAGPLIILQVLIPPCHTFHSKCLA